jgi:hypothetical protein
MEEFLHRLPSISPPQRVQPASAHGNADGREQICTCLNLFSADGIANTIGALPAFNLSADGRLESDAAAWKLVAPENKLAD